MLILDGKLPGIDLLRLERQCWSVLECAGVKRDTVETNHDPVKTAETVILQSVISDGVSDSVIL